MDARSVQPRAAEHACAVRICEWGDNEIARFNRADAGADSLHDADQLVCHWTSRLAMLHLLIWPEIAATNTGAGDGDQGISRFNYSGVRDVLDSHVACTIH